MLAFRAVDGPVLSQTDLYLLAPKLELHPILTHSLKSFHLVFNLANGMYTTHTALHPPVDILRANLGADA